MKDRNGFTLIEMAVVLAIIAILAAMLTPTVVSYIDQARITRANADVTSISKAYLLHYRDTGHWPVYDTSTLAGIGNPSKNCQFSGTSILTGPNSTGVPNWTSLSALGCITANTGLIRAYLNVNLLAGSVGTSNASGGGVSYRGPYLDGLDALDPWGNAYIVNSRALSKNVQDRWAFAISAGPNGLLETDPWAAKSATLTIAGDDIVAIIR
jgi:prepilin-type N-terminal cleavage/methylation domain-containing protein